jgi:hypothetical protein
MIIEDYAAIAARAQALRLDCALRQGRPVSACWCFRQGPGGTNLPCPGAPIAPAADPLDPVRARVRALFGPPFWQEPR